MFVFNSKWSCTNAIRDASAVKYGSGATINKPYRFFFLSGQLLALPPLSGLST